jgi:hypothetical protein
MTTAIAATVIVMKGIGDVCGVSLQGWSWQEARRMSIAGED